jgi:hypothetical protein
METTMSLTQIQLLQQLNSTWNEESDFKVNFLNTGSFFEISNSAQKAHDVSFQSILQALRDILSNAQAKRFINCSQRSPAPFNNNVQEARDLFSGLQSAGEVNCNEWKYFEKLMRVLGEMVFTHPRAKVAAQEQSKLFFNAISRVVHIANGINPFDLDNRIPFTDTNITEAIIFLEIAIEDCTLSIPTTFTSATISNNDNIQSQLNTIFLGAPGTGKSWAIEQQTEGAIKIRTVFHPETQYSDFVGSLRPKMEDFGSGRTVGYTFRPGPFTTAYVQAIKNPSQRVYLVIEEINRAPAASVFGDLFQLIEPDATYEIDIDPDMLDYINGSISPQRIEKLAIPPNLTLLATMNSSDQGVNTLDTAFKRRWAIKYMPIDYDNATSGLLSLPILGTHLLIEWRDFAKVINQKLMEIDVPEDRLLGHRFLSLSEIADINSSRDTLRYKLLVYLWDDVLRHGRRQSIFASEVNGVPLTTFGQLVSAYSDGYSIFKTEVEELLVAAGQIQQVDN